MNRERTQHEGLDVETSEEDDHAESGWRQRGATAVEYAVMAALIAAVIVTIVTSLGSKVSDNFNVVIDEWNQAQST